MAGAAAAFNFNIRFPDPMKPSNGAVVKSQGRSQDIATHQPQNVSGILFYYPFINGRENRPTSRLTGNGPEIVHDDETASGGPTFSVYWQVIFGFSFISHNKIIVARIGFFHNHRWTSYHSSRMPRVSSHAAPRNYPLNGNIESVATYFWSGTSSITLFCFTTFLIIASDTSQITN